MKDDERFGKAHEDVTPADGDQAKSDKLRQRAFEQDVPRLGNHEFWANFIQQEREARKIRERMQGPKPRRLVSKEENRHSAEKNKHKIAKRQHEELGHGIYGNPRVPKKRKLDLRRADEDEPELDEGLFVGPDLPFTSGEYEIEDGYGDMDEQERIKAYHERDFGHKKG